jgi:hypothetical protein
MEQKATKETKSRPSGDNPTSLLPLFPSVQEMRSAWRKRPALEYRATNKAGA